MTEIMKNTLKKPIGKSKVHDNKERGRFKENNTKTNFPQVQETSHGSGTLILVRCITHSSFSKKKILFLAEICKLLSSVKLNERKTI